MLSALFLVQLAIVLASGDNYEAHKHTSPMHHGYMTSAVHDGTGELQSALRQNLVCCACGDDVYQDNVERLDVNDNNNGRGLEDCVPKCAKNLINKIGNCLGNVRENAGGVYYQEAPYQQPVYAIQHVEPQAPVLHVAEPQIQYEAPRRYQLVQRPARENNWCCGLCPCKCFRNRKQAAPVQRNHPILANNYVQTIAPIHREIENHGYENLLMNVQPEIVVDTETYTTTATATQISYETRPTAITDVSTGYNTVATYTYYPVTTQTIVEAKAYLRYPGATVAAEIRPTE